MKMKIIVTFTIDLPEPSTDVELDNLVDELYEHLAIFYNGEALETFEVNIN
jgi:hypothetical protein